MKIAILIFSLSILIISCNSNTTSKQDIHAITSEYKLDTSIIAILHIEKGHSQQFKNRTDIKLSLTDLNATDSLLKKCIDAANDSSQVLKIYTIPFIDLSNYKRQYISYVNSQGDTIVWINCFCSSNDFVDWKENVIQVQDGGICFFNVEVNVTKKIYGNLYINSNA